MPHHTAPLPRLINVDVRWEECGMLIATSLQLPKLLAIATCDEELATDLPALLKRLWEARFGERVEVREAGATVGRDAKWRCDHWAVDPIVA